MYPGFLFGHVFFISVTSSCGILLGHLEEVFELDCSLHADASPRKDQEDSPFNYGFCWKGC